MCSMQMVGQKREIDITKVRLLTHSKTFVMLTKKPNLNDNCKVANLFLGGILSDCFVSRNLSKTE